MQAGIQSTNLRKCALYRLDSPLRGNDWRLAADAIPNDTGIPSGVQAEFMFLAYPDSFFSPDLRNKLSYPGYAPGFAGFSNNFGSTAGLIWTSLMSCEPASVPPWVIFALNGMLIPSTSFHSE